MFHKYTANQIKQSTTIIRDDKWFKFTTTTEGKGRLCCRRSVELFGTGCLSENTVIVMNDAYTRGTAPLYAPKRVQIWFSATTQFIKKSNSFVEKWVQSYKPRQMLMNSWIAGRCGKLPRGTKHLWWLCFREMLASLCVKNK